MWQKVAKFKGAEYFRKALYKCSMSPLNTLLWDYHFSMYIEIDGMSDDVWHRLSHSSSMHSRKAKPP